MADQDRRTSDDQPAGGHAIVGLASALALLIDRLEAHGSLPPGDFQTFLRQTLAHPAINRSAPDAAVLDTLLDILEGAAERLPLTVISGGRDDV